MPGHKILITRQPEFSVEFINKLSYNRFYPYILPMIKTVPHSINIRETMYDFVIVTSKNACNYIQPFMDKLSYSRAIAVGKKTKQCMEMVGFRDVEVPETFSQKGIISYLSGEDIKGKRFFLPGAEERPEELIRFLSEKGSIVDAPTLYTTEKICYQQDYITDFLNQIHIDAVTFLSPSAAKGFFSQVTFSKIKKVPLFVSIGPTTHDYLISIGIESIYPKTDFSVDGVVELLVSIFKS
ncbi:MULTISPECIES: uroporphyrinogen-III synthase [Calditerrivibrio]|uniref:uroporphyrinogen-III synthase n=1 Tax=Calditerrivibrio TaxID=545865 RepID=UPI003C779A1A